MDDRRVGLVLRALRRRRRWRQADVAKACGLSQSVVSRAERGHIDALSLRSLRRLFLALDVRVDVQVRWRGGEVDRLVDTRHASVVAEAARVVRACGWSVQQEVTYAVYGERGSVDLLALRTSERAAVAFEIKTELTSWEETQRRLDVKGRLLHAIVLARMGWQPTSVSHVLVLEETMTNRRRIGRLGDGADAAFPVRGRDVRRWLAAPGEPIRGLWFLSLSPARTLSERHGGFHRVRCRRATSVQRERAENRDPSARGSPAATR